MCKIQDLYNACNMVFEGDGSPPPTSDEIRWLQDLLCTVEATDVGIEVAPADDGSGRVAPVDASSRGSPSQGIKYIHIYECDEFSMGVFCFPAGTKMPLHDHPEMVVLSKVLYGSLSLKAYDWVVKLPNPKYKRCGLASLTVDNRMLDSTSPATVLFPTCGGNIHSITALTSCAILDVLSPPYSEEEGRPSTYYSEIYMPSVSDFVILEGGDAPEDLVVTGAPYLGPELVLYEEGDDGFFD